MPKLLVGGHMSFGERVKDSMLTAGLSVETLANKLEVTPQVIRRWKRDKEAHLSGIHLVKLAQALNVRVTWLATGEGPVMRFHSIGYTEQDMLETFRSLGVKERKAFRDMWAVVMRFAEG